MRLEVGRFVLVATAVVAFGCGESSEAGDGGVSGKGGSSGAAGSGGSSGGPSATCYGETGGAVAPDHVPGTRLKPVVFDLGSGVEVASTAPFTGWIDAELEFDCHFDRAEDGVERCLPSSTATSSYYLDSTCTRETMLAPWPSSCGLEAPSYLGLYEQDENACFRLRGFRVVRELPAPAELYQLSSLGCQATAVSSELDTVYELEHVPPETFVSVTTRRRPRHPDLDAWVREGDDGSCAIVGFYDPERDAPCRPPRTGLAPELACIPDPSATASSFLDAACEQVVARADACQPTPNALLTYDSTSPGCGSVRSYELHEVAETREVSIGYREMNGTCMAATAESVQAHVSGEPIDPATLPSLEIVELGAGPVRARFLGFEGVPFLPLSEVLPVLFQAETGEACFPGRFVDGSYRCRPDSFHLAEPGTFLFTSPSCTGEQVMIHNDDDPSCPSPLRGLVFIENDPLCGGTEELSEIIGLEGPMTASELYRNDGGSCVPLNLAMPTTVYALGQTLAPDTFPLLEHVIRE